ncbi:MAG: ADP-ribosylglycohydrolase family protein [Armatimonadetes bacterium]|nr:ADP-ribosylglycohydrolase family protein [Armatimonadota bacterium]
MSIDRFKGCILGLACADALGGTVEFLSPGQIEAQHGQLRDITGGGWLNLAPGEYTDDTQMMRCLLESILACGQVAPEDVARRFAEWAASGPKDIGNLTCAACRYLREGVRWDQAGLRAWEDSGRSSAGNGGLMRCAPVGLLHFRRPERLDADSRDTCRITHQDPRCQESCVVLNRAVACLVRGEPVTLKPLTEGIADAATLATVRAAMNPDWDASGHIEGFTLDTLGMALWALARFDSFEEGIVRVVNLGGDADTTGAVTGALLGARFGLSALPGRWLAVLQNRDELEQMASDLWAMACESAR